MVKVLWKKTAFPVVKPQTAAETGNLFLLYLEWRLSSKSILIILSYTISNLTRLLWHSVVPQLGGSTSPLFQQLLEQYTCNTAVGQLPVFGLRGTCCLVSCSVCEVWIVICIWNCTSHARGFTLAQGSTWHHLDVCTAKVTCQTKRLFTAETGFLTSGTCARVNARHRLSFSWLWRWCYYYYHYYVIF